MELSSSSRTNRNLFRADTPHAPRAEPLLAAAINEVNKLSQLLSSTGLHKPSVTNGNQELSNGDSGSLHSPYELNGVSSKDRNGNQLQERSFKEEVCQRLASLSTQLHALQAAVIRQDSILELHGKMGPASVPGSAPRLGRSLSRDAGLDGGGEVVLLRRQVDSLQEEVTQLRLKAEGAESRGGRRSNGELREAHRSEQQVSRRRGSRELELHPLAPLATQDPVDQLDGVQEGNEEEEEEVKISPRSDSPRDLQDIPEEGECGAEPS